MSSTSWQWAKANPDAAARRIRNLETENAELRAEVKEQCTLNAKGSEREYSLQGRIEQLERENAALREKMKVSWDEISVLVNQNSALREDKEILDWMNGNIEAIMFKYKPDNFILDVRVIMRGAMTKERQP
jgi:chromosome segregation ATPase